MCWRCNEEIGDMVHIRWSCPKLQTYWTRIHYEINLVLGISLVLSPGICPLHLFAGISKQDIVLLNNVLVTAEILIASHWKTMNIAVYMTGE